MTNKDYISKEAVKAIITKYDDRNFSVEIGLCLGGIEGEIESLPSFSPEAIIEEEIEKLKNTQFLAMIDKKIVEKNRLKDSAFNSGIGEFIDIEIGALQELRSDVEKMDSGWISIKETLPTRMSSILVYSPGSIVGANRVFTVLFDDLEYLESIGITHWQPLPPTPIK